MKNDNVNHPSHYADGCSVECIHMMLTFLGLDGVINYCLGNAYKYLWRHKLKGKPDEDLAKAKWYINEAAFLTKDLEEENYWLHFQLMPKVNEILRIYDVYSSLNGAKKAMDEEELIDCKDGTCTMTKKIDIKEEEKGDWKRVKDYIHKMSMPVNGYPNELARYYIYRIEQICDKHCKADS